MSCRNAAASSQFTVACSIRQGIANHFFFANECNACLFSWHLLTVRRRRMQLRDGSPLCFHRSGKKSQFPSDFFLPEQLYPRFCARNWSERTPLLRRNKARRKRKALPRKILPARSAFLRRFSLPAKNPGSTPASKSK